VPTLLVALAIGWNLERHRRGKSTICCWLRVIPWPVLRPLLAGFFAWWWIHLRDGYRD
jgi:hypothetical protein